MIFTKKKETIPESLERQIEEYRETMKSFNTFYPLVQELVDYSQNTLESVYIDMHNASLYFDKREDVPTGIFCKAEQLHLLATLKQESDCNSWYGDSGKYTTRRNYILTLTSNI